MVAPVQARRGFPSADAPASGATPLPPSQAQCGALHLPCTVSLCTPPPSLPLCLPSSPSSVSLFHFKVPGTTPTRPSAGQPVSDLIPFTVRLTTVPGSGTGT